MRWNRRNGRIMDNNINTLQCFLTSMETDITETYQKICVKMLKTMRGGKDEAEDRGSVQSHLSD